jgi:hypothetical protein
MFEHARTIRLLSSYHDGELSAAGALRVENHLKECTVCRLEYRRLANVTKVVRRLPRMEAPVSLARMIRRRIDAEVRGMVPIFRGELLSCRSRPVLAPALSVGTLIILCLVGGVLLLDFYWGPVARQVDAVLAPPEPPPPFLHVDMTSPRFRDGCVQMLPFTEMESGKAGTVLTLASIDQNGDIRNLHVMDHSGDEQMLTQALDALRTSGFEPARLGNETVAVDFLYLFTTTEVRPPTKGSISESTSIKAALT